MQAVFFIDRHIRGRKQRHLFFLIVFQGGRAVQSIEVIFKQRFFCHRRRFFQRSGWCGSAQDHAVKIRLYTPHITGDQLQGGVVVAGAALVVERYPAGEIDGFFIAGEARHIVRLPGKTAGQVGKIHGLLARLPALQINGQRRAVAQVGRHVAISEADIGGQAGFDAVSVLQHHAVVVGEHCRLLARFLAIRRIGADGGNTLADVFAQERLRAQEVVIKILLQQLQRRAAARDKARRFRHDARGNIAQGNAVRPRIQRQFARLAHQGEIVVINSDGDRLAILAFADGFRDFGKSGVAGGEGKRGGKGSFMGHDDS